MEVYYCQYSQCGKELPPHLIHKSGRAHLRKYCDRECRIAGEVERRKKQGFYQRFSALGNAKQREIQSATGVKPGHKRRSEAMKEHNRLVPRRHVNGWHKKGMKKNVMEEAQPHGRAKHGHYDAERGLPDNTGQAVGSGEKVWLMESVATRWPDLAEQARQVKGDRYRWLVGQLRTMNDDAATMIADEYHERLKAAARDRTQRDRLRQLASFEEQAKTATGDRLAFIEKRIAKLRKQIDKAAEQQ